MYVKILFGFWVYEMNVFLPCLGCISKHRLNIHSSLYSRPFLKSECAFIMAVSDVFFFSLFFCMFFKII